jgi:hypothetical protein
VTPEALATASLDLGEILQDLGVVEATEVPTLENIQRPVTERVQIVHQRHTSDAMRS